MNSRQIAEAIAARFQNITATLPTGETETESAQYLLPDNINARALLVYPPTADVEHYPGKHRDTLALWPVRLLRDPLGVKRRTEWLYAWWDALYDEVGKATTLGGLVTRALPVAVRVEIDGQNYSASTGEYRPFDVVELMVDVLADEVVTSMAP
jgi:hypothetical protein